mgnify:CR=1 FL=1
MAARRYELTDTQWDRIKDLIPRAKTGRPPKDDRMMPLAGQKRCSLGGYPCTVWATSDRLQSILQVV